MGTDLFLRHKCKDCGSPISLRMGRAYNYELDEIDAVVEQTLGRLRALVTYNPKSLGDYHEMQACIDGYAEELLQLGKSFSIQCVIEEGFEIDKQ